MQILMNVKVMWIAVIVNPQYVLTVMVTILVNASLDMRKLLGHLLCVKVSQCLY